MAKARKEMTSFGAIQAGHGPVVQYENIGGGETGKGQTKHHIKKKNKKKNTKTYIIQV